MHRSGAFTSYHGHRTLVKVAVAAVAVAAVAAVTDH